MRSHETLELATMTITDGSAEAEMSSMEKVLNVGDAMSNIMSKLRSAQDWFALSLASKAWHDAVISQASKLVVRRRSSLPHLVKLFRHIRVLDLSSVSEELEDSDLELCAESFRALRSLTLGDEYRPSKITNAGVLAFATKCKFLEHLKLVNLLGLEDAGLQAFGTGCPHLRSLAVVSCSNLTDAAIDAICKFPALVDLELSGTFRLITASALAKIGCDCPNLLKVRLPTSSQSICQTMEAVVEGCPKLQEIYIGFETLLLDPLAQHCQRLTTLTIELFALHVSLDDRILRICSANQDLKELVLGDQESSLSNRTITEIVRGLKLEKFHLAAGGRIFEETVQCIASCPTLRDVMLGFVEADGLGAIGQGSAGLQALSFFDCDGLQNEELESVVSLNRELNRLELKQCMQIGLQGFSAIAQCKHLQILDLSHTKVDDESLVAISRGIQALKQLTLVGCRAIRGTEAVASFKTLETLDIEACRFVSDLSLEILSTHCPRLLHLDVGGANVTDDGLVYLTRCSLLRSLRVAFCRYVKGPGLVHIARGCLCFERVTLSHTFDKSRILEELKEELCEVSLEWDTDSEGRIEKLWPID